MAKKNYLELVKNDYKRMLGDITAVYQKATGFRAMAQSNIPEVKTAYESETGKKMLRNAERVKRSVEELMHLIEKID